MIRTREPTRSGWSKENRIAEPGKPSAAELPLEAHGVKYGADVSVNACATLSVSEITLGGPVAPSIGPARSG